MIRAATRHLRAVVEFSAPAPLPPVRSHRSHPGVSATMAKYQARIPRLFVKVPLEVGTLIALDGGQANYLVNVLRLQPSASVLVFNGDDGEWRAELAVDAGKRTALNVRERTRRQTAAPDLLLAFAPLKHARLDYMVQKAVEMGTSRLAPVFTRHTQPQRVNLERMRANAIEAAEQCGLLAVPRIDEPVDLARLLAAWPPSRLPVFCDEAAEKGDPVAVLTRASVGPSSAQSIGVVIGPEGGFAAEERAALLALPAVVRLPLGPRILRADTAAVAALALVQAVLGDWRSGSPVWRI